MLWIFKGLRWTCNRCMKKALLLAMVTELHPLRRTTNLAQSLTVGTLTSSWSLTFGHSNWKFSKFSYPVGTQKPDIHIGTFLTWGWFFNAFIFDLKNLNLLDIQEHCIGKQAKKRSELKVWFGVYYWFLKLYTGMGSFEVNIITSKEVIIAKTAIPIDYLAAWSKRRSLWSCEVQP